VSYPSCCAISLLGRGIEDDETDFADPFFFVFVVRSCILLEGRMGRSERMVRM
jgi:hypothetical protein